MPLEGHHPLYGNSFGQHNCGGGGVGAGAGVGAGVVPGQLAFLQRKLLSSPHPGAVIGSCVHHDPQGEVHVDPLATNEESL
jgi:hypothetical protein